VIGWFVRWLQELVALAFRLAGQLVAGIFGGLTAPLGPIAVRPGTAAEVVDVRHRVLREGLPRETAMFAGDETGRHWVAARGSQVVGVVSVIPAPMPDPPPDARPVPGYQLRGMAVLPELRGQHLGEALLLAAHRDVAAPMWCNARIAVVGFYAARGWRPVGGTFDVPHAGPHQRMWWPGP
jgi:GNAT superfamily N-acetyltransferase